MATPTASLRLFTLTLPRTSDHYNWMEKQIRETFLNVWTPSL